MSVTDPTGAVQSFPVTDDPDGAYQAFISGMTFKGTYTVAVIAESDGLTYSEPGETWKLPPSAPVSVPQLSMGQSTTFFVFDGLDISRKPRQEG